MLPKVGLVFATILSGLSGPKVKDLNGEEGASFFNCPKDFLRRVIVGEQLC